MRDVVIGAESPRVLIRAQRRRGLERRHGVGEEHGVLGRWPRGVRERDGCRVTAAARAARGVSVVAAAEGKRATRGEVVGALVGARLGREGPRRQRNRPN